jgi:hypothetical protein
MGVDARRLQRILVAVIAILSIVLGGGLLLPRSWEVDREIAIAVPPPVVYAEVNSLRRWRAWSVWDEREPALADEYSGPEAGPGATRRWTGAGGRGVMKIMANVRDRKVEYELLIDGGAFALSGAIRTLPEDSGTRVVWRAGFRSGGNPLERYLALVMRLQLGRDLDASLARLKARLEKTP